MYISFFSILYENIKAFRAIVHDHACQSFRPILHWLGFPGGSDSKASVCNTGDSSSIPGLGRSPGEGNGNPLQYSCLENPMDGEAWWATVHGVAKSWTQLSNFTFTLVIGLLH